MAEIEDVVDVSITIKDQTIEQSNFGLGLIVGNSDKLTSKVQSFASIEEVEAVFDVGNPELVAATKFFSQQPNPPSVLIANREADEKQKEKITIPQLANNADYTVTIVLEDLTSIAETFTSDSDATRAEIVDGLIAALNGNEEISEDFTLTDNGDDFDVEHDTAGTPFTVTVSSNLAVSTLNEVKNITSELIDISALNNTWYALMSTSHADIDIKRAAAYIQARRKVYAASSENADIISPEREIVTLDFDADFVTSNAINLDIDGVAVAETTFTSDQATTIAALAANIAAHSEVSTATVTDTRQITITADDFDRLLLFENIVVAGGASQANGEITVVQDPTTDLGAELEALGYDRTALIYHSSADSLLPEAAMLGGRLAKDPGAETAFGKSLVGITTDDLSSAESNKARGNNVNTYEEIGGVGFFRDGKMCSGRFFDVRRDVDYIEAQQEETIFSRIVNTDKIPYTNDGANLVGSDAKKVLLDNPGIIAEDPEPVVNVPDVRTDVSANDRGNRLLPDITYTAFLAGAIHTVKINGTISI